MLKLSPSIVMIPFILFLLIYITSMQLFKSHREATKQYFDILTGLYNRKGLSDKIVPAIRAAIEDNKTAHIFAIDVNKFKAINVKYGHAVGDKVIKLISVAIRHVSHKDDHIIRYGGDKFLVALIMDNDKAFDHDNFIECVNQKIAYDCHSMSTPLFTISSGYIEYNIRSHQSLDDAFQLANSLLLEIKTKAKIQAICEQFDEYELNLSEEELTVKQDIFKRLDFVQAEDGLQKSLNERVLYDYQLKLNYIMSGYYSKLYSCKRTNNDLQEYRMKIIESHHTKDVPMSVFYIMFIKYGAKLFDDIVLSEEEKTINNRLLAYELNFIAGINNR